MGEIRGMRDGSPGIIANAAGEGRVRLRPLGEGRYKLTVSMAPGTFPATVMIDNVTLRAFLAAAIDMATADHEVYAAELRTELAKWVAGEPPYGTPS